ncbi:DeoR/GlpR transcriptional regulator [Alicyclobacillus curvatus]|nr:DeoR/GlpR transcriptional regulator [Alicyclobacillus curvatus]
MSERLRRILQLIEQNKFVSVNDLSKSLQVSEVTIRKDLRTLEEQGLVSRTHGGASVRVSNFQPFMARQLLAHDEKWLLANVTAELVEEGDSVIIDAGTTPLQVAKLLLDRHLSVVTNSLPVSMELAHSSCTVTVTGGVVFPENVCLVGPEAEGYFERIRVNKLILGASGLVAERGPTTYSALEAAVKQRMVKAAQMVILVMDHSKLTNVGLSVFCEFSDIDTIVTSSLCPEHLLQEIRAHGVEVISVPIPKEIEVGT